ncbi:DUF7553 family protein [Halomicrobium salinisoli]|uniref:DUF7553 family protein n=1 Tax=Halomicrobium salinisoli TaxID=2878391 RepID=UPI001CF0A7A7|nr:hypothetical protein [Halomicrobium salinisoli]
MGCSPLVDANRRLLAAIETPPDSGLEDRLDDVAATVWTLEHEVPADPGACCRLRQKLRRLEREACDRRAAEIERARRALESYGRRLEAV